MAFNIKGLKIQDIMQLSQGQLNRLSDSDLRKVASREVSAANKRIRRLQAKGLEESYAYRQIEGKQFSIKGLSREEVISAISEMSHFLTLKTSKAGEVEKAIKKIEKTTGYKLNEEETAIVNKAYGAFKDAAEKGYAQSNYNQVREDIIEMVAINRNGLISEEDIIERAKELGHEQKIESFEKRKREDETPTNFSEYLNAGDN